MGSQLAQYPLVRMATWLTSAMLALPALPGALCACPISLQREVATRCGHGAEPATSGSTCCCCARHPGPTSGAECRCNEDDPTPTPPAAPTGQAQSSADQLLAAQTAVSAALPPDARLGNTSAAPLRGNSLAACSALERCIVLSRLNL
jgi:hypothetical protein